MTLAFISPGTADRGVAAESPFAAALEEAGARFEIRDHWRVAVSVGEEGDAAHAVRATVGWADVSHLGKLEVQAAPDGAAAIAELAGGVKLGTARRHRDAWWCPVTPLRALVVCEPGHTATLHAELEATEGLEVVDVTAQLAALRVAGPLTRELVARFCALDLRDAQAPVGAFRPGSIARAPGYVLREGADRWLLLSGAAYALHHWKVVDDAGRRLGGRPVGLDALTTMTTTLDEATRA